MIKSLEIRNFQSHKNTHLNFAPGINIIVGQSDSGKSAILRALRWLLWNKPNGEAFRSHWPGDTEVYMEVDRQLLSRMRTNSENQYQHNGKVFTAFGADVPEEIQQACNITDVNFQSQLERPFLLDDTPGQVASYLNSIADLSVIDSSMKNVQKWMGFLKGEVARHLSNKGEYETRLKAFEHLSKMEKDIRAAEQMDKELAEERRDHIDLFHLHDSVEQVNQKIAQFQPILALEKQVDMALETMTKIKAGKQNCVDLFETISDISHNRTKIQKLKALTDLEQSVLSAAQLQQSIKSQEMNHRELIRLTVRIDKNREQILLQQDLIKSLENQFHLQMPDICPLCGQEVPK